MASNLADLELTTGTPILAVLCTTQWVGQCWTEFRQESDFEAAGSRVSSGIRCDVGDFVGAPEESLTWTMSTAFDHFRNADIIAEMWLVPRDGR